MAETCDFLVIGSGIAGLSFALEASEVGDVVLVTKRAASDSNTQWAQGGIAAVLGEGDTFEAHIRDTLVAGAGLSHERVVEICVKEGPDRIRMLDAVGARFDHAHDAPEGGRGARRLRSPPRGRPLGEADRARR